MEGVISLHQHRVDRIEEKWENDKEVGEGRRRVCRTRHVRKVEVTVISLNRRTNSWLMAKTLSLGRAGIAVAGIKIPL